MHVSKSSGLVQLLKNSGITKTDVAVGLATSLASSYLGGTFSSYAPREVQAALIPIISVYSAGLGSSVTVAGKIAGSLTSTVDGDIEEGKIKPD